MYRISSTNGFIDGRLFDGLVEAVRFADKHGNTHCTDVLAVVDNRTYRAVYTGGLRYCQVNRGTYKIQGPLSEQLALLLVQNEQRMLEASQAKRPNRRPKRNLTNIRVGKAKIAAPKNRTLV